MCGTKFPTLISRMFPALPHCLQEVWLTQSSQFLNPQHAIDIGKISLYTQPRIQLQNLKSKFKLRTLKDKDPTTHRIHPKLLLKNHQNYQNAHIDVLPMKSLQNSLSISVPNCNFSSAINVEDSPKHNCLQTTAPGNHQQLHNQVSPLTA